MMKKIFLGTCLLSGALSVCSSVAASDQSDLQKAVNAIRSGDINGASKLLLPLAQHGNGEAQAHLWSILKTTDEKQANMWLLRSAENGYAQSVFTVGLMYLQGNGVNEDPVMALKYLKQASEAGIAPAQRHLGMLYRNGPNSIQNDSEAARWLGKAALAGDAEAQYQFAELHRYGYGVTPDMLVMRKWLTLSAEQGNEKAAAALAEISR